MSLLPAVIPRAPGYATIAIIVWLMLLLVRVIAALHDPAGLKFDTDDALRMVEVRDLLAGQSWFDLTQYRMTPPVGIAMHWSRLIDAPLAGLILLFRPFATELSAEALAATIWPALLLLPTWLAVGRMAQRLADAQAGHFAVLLAIASLYPFGFFRPGEIDHHNAQLALTLTGIALLLDIERTRAAVACAALNAVSLGIGLETLPYVLVTCLAVSVAWIVRGPALSGSVCRFGLTFATTSMFLLLAVVANHERTSVACDTFSGFYALLAIAGGGGLAAATVFPLLSGNTFARAASVTLLAIGLATLTLLLAPQCLHGPYATVSPELDRIWLSRVEEAQSPWFSASSGTGFFFATYIYALAGVAMSAAAATLVERGTRMAVVTVAIFCAIAVAVATFEARGLPFAILTGIPGIAVAIRRLTQQWIKPGFGRAAVATTALAAFSEVAFLMIGNYGLEGAHHVEQRVLAHTAALDCMNDRAAAQLARLPKGRVADFLAAAPAILLYTHDSVMAGSYHRDGTAILELYRLFTDSPDVGAAIVRKYGIDYVVTCRADEDYAFYIREGGPRGLLSDLDKGNFPSWLAPVAPSGRESGERIYRVLP